MTMAVNRTTRVSVAVGAFVVLGAGVAYGYWSSGGAGAGRATSGTMTITAAALAGEHGQSSLYPGGSADAIVKVANPNGYSVQVVAITATGPPQAGNGC